MNRDGKEEKSSINTVSHDAPTMSVRFVYGSTTTHAGSATIHPDGATKAQECSRFDTVLVRFKPVAPQQCQDLLRMCTI